jgi:hypothetical protein
MKPTIGRIVHYTLTKDDAEEINRRRTDSPAIISRMQLSPPQWPAGAQAHIGNSVAEGDVYPAIIVRTWGSTPESSCQLQVFLDGNDTYWATSRSVGTTPGTWAWPTRE